MLYEVLAPGYHSPLTKTQITELFHAGRLERNHPCKPLSQKHWRTVDELFPLLKYQSATISWDEPWEPVRRPAIDRSVVLACIAVALAVAALWFYLRPDSNPTSSVYRAAVSETRWPRTASTPGTRAPTVASQRLQQERPQPQQPNDVATNSVVITPELPVMPTPVPWIQLPSKEKPKNGSANRLS
jgi:hypothetical protein